MIKHFVWIVIDKDAITYASNGLHYLNKQSEFVKVFETKETAQLYIDTARAGNQFKRKKRWENIVIIRREILQKGGSVKIIKYAKDRMKRDKAKFDKLLKEVEKDDT